MYDYQVEKPKIFTEEGQIDFLKVRDNVRNLLKQSGAVTMDRAITGLTGDSWTMMAYVDRLVEIGEIREVSQSGRCAGQNRIFVSTF